MLVWRKVHGKYTKKNDAKSCVMKNKSCIKLTPSPDECLRIPVCTAHIVCALCFYLHDEVSFTVLQYASLSTLCYWQQSLCQGFCPFLKCHCLTTGSMRGRRQLKSPELALTSAHRWVLFLRSVLQSCKHDASFFFLKAIEHRSMRCTHCYAATTLCLLADFLLYLVIFSSLLLSPKPCLWLKPFCQTENPQETSLMSLILILKTHSWYMTVLFVDVTTIYMQIPFLIFSI